MFMRLSAVVDGEEVPVRVFFNYERADRTCGVRAYLEIDTITLDGEEITLPEEERERLIDQAWDVIDRRRDEISAKREDAWLRSREAYHAD